MAPDAARPSAVASLAPAAYAFSAFGSAVVHNVWVLFIFPIFVNVYGVGGGAFSVVQVLFAVWNSLNDPLFGWLVRGGRGEARAPLRLRQRAMWWGGAGMAMSFLLPFWSWVIDEHEGGWGGSGDGSGGTLAAVHLLVALFTYDGFLTYVSVSHQALLADATAGLPSVRHRCVVAAAGASVVASVGLLPCYSLWASGNLVELRVAAFCLALLSAVAFGFAGLLVGRLADRRKRLGGGGTCDAQEATEAPSASSCVGGVCCGDAPEGVSAWAFAWQLASNGSFRLLSLLLLVQVFNCHAVVGFFMVELDVLARDVDTSVRAAVLAAAFVAPHLSTMALAPLLDSKGTYAVVRGLLVFKAVLAAATWLAGVNAWPAVLLFLLVNRVGTEGTCRLADLLVADVVDEDAVVWGRNRRLAAPIFGAAALISKPGQSVAPLVGYWWLAVHGGGGGGGEGMGADLRADNSVTADSEMFRLALFRFMVGVPLFCALVQLAVFRRFGLRDGRLTEVREAVHASRLDDDDAADGAFGGAKAKARGGGGGGGGSGAKLGGVSGRGAEEAALRGRPGARVFDA